MRGAFHAGLAYWEQRDADRRRVGAAAPAGRRGPRRERPGALPVGPAVRRDARLRADADRRARTPSRQLDLRLHHRGAGARRPRRQPVPVAALAHRDAAAHRRPGAAVLAVAPRRARGGHRRRRLRRDRRRRGARADPLGRARLPHRRARPRPAAAGGRRSAAPRPRPRHQRRPLRGGRRRGRSASATALWRGNDWSGPRVRLGHLDSCVEQAVAMVDFTSRNGVDAAHRGRGHPRRDRRASPSASRRWSGRSTICGRRRRTGATSR